MKKVNLFLVIMFMGMLVLSGTSFALDYKTIQNNMNNMTELQWDQYSESLKGQYLSSGADWQEKCLISDVREKDGKYTVLIDQGIYFWDVPKSKAYSLRKNQEVYYYGTIGSVINVSGRCVIIMIYGGILP